MRTSVTTIPHAATLESIPKLEITATAAPTPAGVLLFDQIQDLFREARLGQCSLDLGQPVGAGLNQPIVPDVQKPLVL